MASTLTKTIADFSLQSWWNSVSWAPQPSVESVTKTFDLTSIMDGSTIESATLSGAIRTQKDAGFFTIESNGNTWESGRVNVNAGTVAFSVNAKPWFSGGKKSGNLSVDFIYTAAGFGQGQGYNYEYGYYEGITLTISYNLPYTACTAPTTVKLSVPNTYPGQKTTLSWSGAKAGTNNAITGYEIYRSTSSSSSGFTKLASVAAGTTSYSITSPTTAATYYYKVKTLGTVSGYDSGLSSAYATLSMTSTACTAPTSITVSNASPGPMMTVSVSWSGAKAGTNNPITGYNLYKASSASGTYN